MSVTKTSLPLLNILETQILPLWIQSGMEQCLIVPTDFTDKARLTKWQLSGATVIESPRLGPRIAVKGPRNYANINTNRAVWPQDNLRERADPVLGCVFSGHADFQVNDSLLHCQAGHTLLFLPGTSRPDGSLSHLAGTNRRDGFCDVLWIGAESQFGLSCWVCHSEQERHYERPGESCTLAHPWLMKLFDDFISEATARRGSYREICQLLLQTLLLAVCREIREDRLFQFHRQKPEHPSEAMHPWSGRDPIVATREYIQSHLHEPLRIDDVAQRFFFSRSQFTRRFKRETGGTFNDYLTRARLEEAKRLLRETEWSIAIVSKAVGFQSSRLRALFNNYYGLSPQQFRQDCRTQAAIEK